MLNYDTFPNQDMVGGLRRYFENGIPPGSFLSAVICNDLEETCGRADHVNSTMIPEIVGWFYNEAPHWAWKSEEAYHRVINNGGAKGAWNALAKEA